MPHGNTVWVQADTGPTILRIRSSKGIVADSTSARKLVKEMRCLVEINQPIEFCLTEAVGRQLKESWPLY